MLFVELPYHCFVNIFALFTNNSFTFTFNLVAVTLWLPRNPPNGWQRTMATFCFQWSTTSVCCRQLGINVLSPALISGHHRHCEPYTYTHIDLTSQLQTYKFAYRPSYRYTTTVSLFDTKVATCKRNFFNWSVQQLHVLTGNSPLSCSRSLTCSPGKAILTDVNCVSILGLCTICRPRNDVDLWLACS